MARIGVWTPAAAVWCVECHGPNFPGKQFDTSSKEWEETINDVYTLNVGQAITTCRKCGNVIIIRDSVAEENNLVLRLQKLGIDAEMTQTGGMNSACEVNRMDGGFYWITYNFDGDGYWWVASYDREGELEENDYSSNGWKGAEETYQIVRTLPFIKYL